MKKSIVTLLSIVLVCAWVEGVQASELSDLGEQKQVKVLLVLTSHGDLGRTGLKTGFWLEEFAAPYYALTDAGVAVTLASPKGGQPPLDPKSEYEMFQTDATRRFAKDKEAQERLAQTVELSTISASDFDAVFYSGGYGPLWDLAEDESSISLIEAFYGSSKPVASVCHAPAIFKNTKDVEGKPLVQ